MSQEIFDVRHPQVQMVMVVHMQYLQQHVLDTLRYDDLEAYLKDSLWAKQVPKTLAKAVDDILKVSANDIVRFMSMQAQIKGAHGNLADFLDLIGG